jgi:LPPG:FO 2-phospho-L-lactate transferase
VTKIIYQGIERAVPSDSFTQALSDSRLKRIVFCPSNPFLSLDPILHLPGIAQRVRESKAKVVAVSPIIGNAAVKGPAAKMLQELGMQVSAYEIARYYQDLLDCIFIDKVDAHLVPLIEALGVNVVVSSILMKDDADRTRLAREVLEYSV